VLVDKLVPRASQDFLVVKVFRVHQVDRGIKGHRVMLEHVANKVFLDAMVMMVTTVVRDKKGIKEIPEIVDSQEQ
jgi:hypothetical protein